MNQANEQVSLPNHQARSMRTERLIKKYKTQGKSATDWVLEANQAGIFNFAIVSRLRQEGSHQCPTRTAVTQRST